MIGIYSILLGAAIVVGALFLLRREFKQAYFIGPREKTASMSVSDRADTTLEALDEMESAFTQMSEAFYDITGDLEGKFSVHEKELVLYLERIEALEKKVQDQKMLIEKQETALGQLDQRLQIKPSIEEKVGQPRGYMNKGMDNKESEDNIEMRETAFDLENRITHSNHEAVFDSNKPTAETNTKERIIALRSQGYSLKQIAKELNIGLGEIQLILNMKRS